MMTQHARRSLLTRLATAFCAVMMFFGLVAAPGFAGNMFTNEPSEPPTPNIMKDAEDIADPNKQPMNLDEIQARTNGGINEIQGTSDADKMIKSSEPGKPDNAIARTIDKEMKKAAK